MVVKKNTLGRTSNRTSLISIEQIAAEQGVGPFDFDPALGVPHPEDETAEEFQAMLRRWRTEGSSSSRRK